MPVARSVYCCISIHALREEGDPPTTVSTRNWQQFLSTPSARRATTDGASQIVVVVFLSTPSARRATQPSGERHGEFFISIHALREEGDFLALALGQILTISIHALREEGDPLPLPVRRPVTLFLSTPSARRATGPECPTSRGQLISIHALREEGDCAIPGDRQMVPISIHALREEGDRRSFSAACAPSISIHALREEGDVLALFP